MKKSQPQSNITASYVRCSTISELGSGRTQMDVIRKYAKKRGLKIVKPYSNGTKKQKRNAA